MVNKIVQVSLCTLALISQSLAAPSKEDAGGDKLHFVYELTRHGARAPTDSNDGYTVGPGMLTPQGMRQRYLLGAYNKKRYSETYDLIDLEDG